jgi:hypothetical protein
MDYNKLEGKIFDYDHYGEIFKGKVSLVDPDIGLTAVFVDEPEKYMICLILPGSPQWGGGNDNKDIKGSRIVFDLICNQIMEGVVVLADLNTEYENHVTPLSLALDAMFGTNPTVENCPF